VQVEKVDLPWQMVVLRKNNALSHLLKVQPLLAQFPYASAGLVGQDEPVMILRIAAENPVDDAWLAELDRLLEMDDDLSAMAYHDVRRGISKWILVRDGEVVAARLSGEIAAHEWLKDGMAKGLPIESVRAWLLAPLATPPSGVPQRGRIICNCLNVAESEIHEELAAATDFAGLQEKLKCGTQCGSCVPEIKRMFIPYRDSEAEGV
jgi:assimilatory nitrate reductase catalytic subunit